MLFHFLSTWMPTTMPVSGPHLLLYLFFFLHFLDHTILYHINLVPKAPSEFLFHCYLAPTAMLARILFRMSLFCCCLICSFSLFYYFSLVMVICYSSKIYNIRVGVCCPCQCPLFQEYGIEFVDFANLTIIFLYSWHL